MFLHLMSSFLCRKLRGAWGHSAAGVMLFPHRAEDWEGPDGHDKHTRSPTDERGETGECQWCVNLSAAAFCPVFILFWQIYLKKKVKSFCTLIQMAGYCFEHLIVILWRFSSSLSESLLIWVMPSEMRIRAIWNSDATLDDQLWVCLLIQKG